MTVAPSDADRLALMRLAQDGDADAFGALYEDLAPCALRIASVIVRSPDRARDVVHEAFLAMWRTREHYRPEAGAVHSWAFGIVRTFSLTDDEDDEGAQAGLDPFISLPLAQREVIALAYHGGLTHTEIAQQLSLPPDTVKGRMRLGLGRLRARLDAGARA